MSDTGNTDLRKLAHEYYRGELSYASYRQARTRLLDRITAVPDDDDGTVSVARQANKPDMAGKSPGYNPERSRLLQGAILLLIVAMITAILLVWAIKSEAMMLSLGQADPTDRAFFAAIAERTGINSKEDDRHSNG
jgi:hypothetical protein